VIRLPAEPELRARLQPLFERWGVARELADVGIEWCNRLQTAAGRAWFEPPRIKLNPKLLARVPGAVEQVLVHEAAHLAVHLRHGGRVRPHGQEWRELMQAAGLPPHATHRYPIQGLARTRYWYLHLCVRCGGRAILRQARRLRCCGTMLRVRAPRSRQGYGMLARMTREQARAL
jgi:predicted SprT family Zn-dependent metalloprotease